MNSAGTKKGKVHTDLPFTKTTNTKISAKLLATDFSTGDKIKRTLSEKPDSTLKKSPMKLKK
jgi:hypothetical protein